MPSPVTEERVAWRLGALSIDMAPALGWSIAFGICVIAYYIVKALFEFPASTAETLFGWIPGVNKLVKVTILKAEQKVTHWIGQAAAASEARMGDAFHAAAIEAASIGHEIYGEAIATWQIAQWLGTLIKAIGTGEAWQEIFHNDIKALQGSYAAQQQKIARQQKAIDHAANNPIGAGIRTHTKPIAASQAYTGELTLPGLRDWVKGREKALEEEQAATRTRVGTLEGDLTAVRDKVTGLAKATSGVLATALAVTALARIGLDWIRCSKVSRVGKRLCGIDDSLLGDLLAGTLLIAGSISIVGFAKELQAIVDVENLAIRAVIREARKADSIIAG